MRLNRTSLWKVMTIWISRELPLFKYERLNILCAWIGPPCEKLWPFEYFESFHWSISSVLIYDSPELDIRVKTDDHFNFPRASVVQFRASQYIKRLHRTSVWKVMTIWISLELQLINSEHLDMWYTWIGHPSEKLWLFEFVESLRCSISIVSTNYAPVSDICVKSYDHWNFSRASVVRFRAPQYVISLNQTLVWKVMTIWISPKASVVHFRASLYVMHLNRTSVWKVMTIWISRELPMFNFERLNIW